MGHAVGSPAPQTCLFAGVRSLSAASAGQTDPRDTSLQRTSRWACHKLPSRVLYFFCRFSYPSLAVSYGPHPTSSSDSATSSLLFQSTLRPSSDEMSALNAPASITLPGSAPFTCTQTPHLLNHQPICLAICPPQPCLLLRCAAVSRASHGPRLKQRDCIIF